MRSWVAALAALAAVRAAAGYNVYMPWQQEGKNAARTGNSHMALTIEGVVAWRHYGAQHPIKGSPVIAADGAVFYTTTDGNVTALEGDTGKLRFTQRFGASFEAAPALSSDSTLLFAGNFDGTMWAVNTVDGLAVWHYSVPGNIVAAPAVDTNSFVYFASTNGYLYCLSRDGRQQWVQELSGGRASPALLDGVLYAVSNEEKRLIGYNMNNRGRIKFLEEVESKAEFSDVTACSADMFGGDGAVVYSDGAELVAHNAKTGVQLWRVKAGDNPNNAAGSPVAFGDDGTIFFGAPDKELYAYGSDTTFMWSTEFQGSITAAPVVGPGQVLAVSSAGDLRSLDSVTGTLQWVLSLYPGGITASPALGDYGLMYVAAWDGSITAVGRPQFPTNPPPKHKKNNGVAIGVSVTVIVLAAAGGAYWYKRRRASRSGYSSFGRDAV